MEPKFKAFGNWEEVLVFVRNIGHVWYWAPMDTRPVKVTAQRRGNGRKVRLVPDAAREADPFWADEGHLDRFRWLCRFELQDGCQ